MAKNSAIVCVALFLSLMLLAPRAQAALTCDTVTSSLRPCSSAMQKGGAVTAACCSGVQSLNSAASTPAARKAACECVKSLAKSYKVGPQLISTIANKCKVKIPNMDCSKVN